QRRHGPREKRGGADAHGSTGPRPAGPSRRDSSGHRLTGENRRDPVPDLLGLLTGEGQVHLTREAEVDDDLLGEDVGGLAAGDPHRKVTAVGGLLEVHQATALTSAAWSPMAVG